jgi:peptide deformylase
MSLLKIIQYPDLRLRRKAEKVIDFSDSRLQAIINDMLQTLAQATDCAALAATQLDIDLPPSLTVINNLEGLFSEPTCLINPVIEEMSGTDLSAEGCMSVFPQSITAPVERAASVKVVAQDRSGKQFTIEAKGFLARCLQHEVDHLNGIIYLDHLSALRRGMLKKKIEKLSKVNIKISN